MTMQTVMPLVRLPLSEGNEPIEQIANYPALLLDPPYQRGSVWGLTRRRNLIRSLMQGIPTGGIHLNTRPDDAQTLAVVDGKQRIETVRAFFADEFTAPASWFAAAHVREVVDTDDGPYLRHSGLTEVGQRRFSRAQFTTLRTSMATVAEEADLFTLVNFGGVQQGDRDTDTTED